MENINKVIRYYDNLCKNLFFSYSLKNAFFYIHYCNKKNPRT